MKPKNKRKPVRRGARKPKTKNESPSQPIEEFFADPFLVIGAIPEGKTYQWVACSILGNKDDLAARHNAQMREGGWRPVPARRHPKMPARGGKIEFGGQVLMERPQQLTDAAIVRESAKAREQICDSRAQQEAFGPISSYADTIVPPGPDVSATVDEAKEKLKRAGGEHYVEITIGVVVSDREIASALALCLEPQEYMRRRIIMDTQALALATNEYGTPIADRHAVFRRAQFIVKKETQS